MKKISNSYLAVGIAFVVASIIAVATNHMILFTSWLPIGAAFIFISRTEKTKNK
jgi:hypothetical protein